MNDSLSPFERELRGHVPREPSPHLQEQLAVALDAAPGPRRRWIGPALAAAAALVILATVMWPPPTPVPRPPVVVHPLQVPPPNALAYRRALAESEQALDRLLDEHARVLLRGDGRMRPLDFLKPSADPELQGDQL
ncbi:MAG: hypothetical protein OER86_04630 [Phycisphaerae bacterium]|nr:hypothetical protein [Phycisphaerae bacterium]